MFIRYTIYSSYHHISPTVTFISLYFQDFETVVMRGTATMYLSTKLKARKNSVILNFENCFHSLFKQVLSDSLFILYF